MSLADEPEGSRFFASAQLEDRPSIVTESEGDLWPSCWADDGHLYAANGDGYGFTPSSPRPDIAVSRIVGDIPELRGETLATGDALGSVWTPGGQYNRKPTGMLCAGGILYLALQDLRLDFDDVPAASISCSRDHGRTWEWDRSAPLFSDHRFTTLIFADLGKDSHDCPDGHAYVYGLDGNWRASFRRRVPDPTELFLARVPLGRVMDREAWRFYAGLDAGGSPQWSERLDERRPVLRTHRRVYPSPPARADQAHDMTVLSQGSVVYNRPLNRYLYTSWTEFTFEFYEAPTPWGPWRLFLSRDFGPYPWTEQCYGGYGVTIPSKFVSEDGRTMWVQSATFAGGVDGYRFSLRKLTVEPSASL